MLSIISRVHMDAPTGTPAAAYRQSEESSFNCGTPLSAVVMPSERLFVGADVLAAFEDISFKALICPTSGVYVELNNLSTRPKTPLRTNVSGSEWILRTFMRIETEETGGKVKLEGDRGLRERGSWL